MPLFGKSSKSPVEVVKLLKESLATLEKGGDGKKQEKAQEDVSKQLLNIKNMLFGTESSEQQSDIILAQLSQVRGNEEKIFKKIKNIFYFVAGNVQLGSAAAAAEKPSQD